jgi:hypothetical protein
VYLPPGGYAGPVPTWPIGEATADQIDLWLDLWRTPQAAAWVNLGWTRTVARYAALVLICEGPDMTAALLSELRQMEDRLGLSPMALKRLQWEIEPAEVESVGPVANVAQLFG